MEGEQEQEKESIWLRQALPLFLTLAVFLLLFGVLYVLILGLNALNLGTPVVVHLRWGDILFGLTIYLKTSVDFAIFIGNLIKANPGYKARIAVEIGTALGNATGTFLILGLWQIFKELDIILAIMVFLASLVLLRLAADSLEHAKTAATPSSWLNRVVLGLDEILDRINQVIAPVLKYIIPHGSFTGRAGLGFWPLLGFAFTIPFLLGMDDFAGYVPLFSIVNVFGFASGVFLGHMILNAFLYLSPSRTIKAVTNPVISFLGSVVFIALALYGFNEVVRILLHD